MRCGVGAGGLLGLDFDEQLVFVNGVADADVNGTYDASRRGLQLVFHLHRLQNGEPLISLDLLSFLHEDVEHQSGHGRAHLSAPGQRLVETELFKQKRPLVLHPHLRAAPPDGHSQGVAVCGLHRNRYALSVDDQRQVPRAQHLKRVIDRIAVDVQLPVFERKVVRPVAHEGAKRLRTHQYVRGGCEQNTGADLNGDAQDTNGAGLFQFDLP